MFGYICVDKPELRVRDYNAYRGFYCGLCRAIKTEYSQTARLLLNHDCAFFYLLSDALSEAPCTFAAHRCPLHPTEKRYCAQGGAERAAALNVLLAVEKLRDDAADDRSLGAALAAGALSRQYKKAAQRYPDIARATREGIAELSALEKESCPDIDRVCGVFAELLAQIFEQAGEEKPQLRSLGYSLGRWIYLIDAAEDAEKDAKKGSYNPFIAKFGSFNEQAREAARFNLYASLSAAAAAYDLLSVRRYKEILENMLYSALYKRTRSVISGGKEQ